jgi:hypothetical protein
MFDTLFSDGMRLISDITGKNWLDAAQTAINVQQHALDIYKSFNTTKAGSCGPDDVHRLEKLSCDLTDCVNKCNAVPVKAGAEPEKISPADIISIVSFIITLIQKIRAQRAA